MYLIILLISMFLFLNFPRLLLICIIGGFLYYTFYYKPDNFSPARDDDQQTSSTDERPKEKPASVIRGKDFIIYTYKINKDAGKNK